MDGTENKQDSPATSTLPETSGDKQGTSTETPQTFTAEQVKAMAEKAVNDYAARTGRKEETLTKREKAILEAETRRQKEEEDREVAELEGVKDKPEELPLVQRKQQLAKDIRTFNSEKSKYQPILDVINELGITDAESLRKTIEQTRATNFELVINKAATENQVDAVVLSFLALSFGLTDENLIKELASSMPKKTAMPVTDSGKTNGGSKELTTDEKLKKRYPTMD